MENNSYIPYGRQQIDEDDIAAVVDVLRSDWLTTGPMVDKFEQAVADYTGAKYAVAVSSGTAALHAAMFAIGIGPGDEVIVPPMTFVATANAVVYQGGTPVFVDIEAETLLINPDLIEEKITPRTKAIIAVDYAGQPCDYDRLNQISQKYGLILIADASHSLGASYKGRRCGSLADITTFSFHPVKPITCGEGGMVVTNSATVAEFCRHFRHHGISQSFRERQKTGQYQYDMIELGYNYRLSDLQAALGLSQMNKLTDWVALRQKKASIYDLQLQSIPEIRSLKKNTDSEHGYHLYVVRVSAGNRDALYNWLKQGGIGANVHYRPVHLHSFYQQHYNTHSGCCPRAENAGQEILSLPIFPHISERDIRRIGHKIRELFTHL